MNKRIIFLTQAGAVAALYVVLSMISAAFGLSSGVIQVRISECLCVLPLFFSAAVPGLFLGCLITNLLTGAVVWDVVFGSLATLIGAVGTYLLRKKKVIAVVVYILANVIVVPLVLVYAYQVREAYWLVAASVGIGEIVSAGLLGYLFYMGVKKIYPSIKM